ncbi:MAG: baseplate J/gp47 family protein [Desulfovibrio sp.]|jgi:uncharacterized phage protein gp47/JayE|nr:baseplate J/gp47 family protein [Desulfovibrio sp.]
MYSIPSFEDIRAAYLRDVKNLDDTAHADADSDHFVRASATAGAVDGLYHHQIWIARQILPDTADPEYLEQHAALRGITRKPATKAAGTLQLTLAQANISQFPAGLSAVLRELGTDGTETETRFVTTAPWPGGPVPEGGISLPCSAALPGAMPDYDDLPVTLQSPPAGVMSDAALTLRGGSDVESNAELLARLLYYMRNPPGGGRATDYELWALEVPGVAFARCYPLRRGPGTVDVVITGGDGLPSDELVTAVQSHIDMRRPVACPDALVLAPVPVTVDVSALVRVDPYAGLLLPALTGSARAELALYFDGLAPGDGVVAAKLAAIILGVPGIGDVSLTAPAANVAPQAVYWPRLGDVALGTL